MARRFLAALAAGLTLATQVLAADPVQQNNTNMLWFENWTGLSNAMLRVADPDGYITTVTAGEGTPVYQLDPENTLDGVYRYELRAATDEKVRNRDYDPDRADQAINANAAEEYINVPFYRTGSFVVERGVILRPEEMETEKEGDNG